MKGQTRKLYALAAVLGLLESGNKDDDFHTLVYGITGKAHISELTAAEGKTVEAELRKMLNNQNSNNSGKKDIPGMMTKKQKKYAEGLAIELAKLDGNTKATIKQRLAGAVRKTLHITAPPDDPLRWVRKDEGIKLIEALKRYVVSAEKKNSQSKT